MWVQLLNLSSIRNVHMFIGGLINSPRGKIGWAFASMWHEMIENAGIGDVADVVLLWLTGTWYG